MSIKTEMEKIVMEAFMEDHDCSIADYEKIYLDGANEARRFIISMGRAMADGIPTDCGIFEMGQADGIRWFCDRIAEFEEE